MEGYEQFKKVLSSTARGIKDTRQGFSQQTTTNAISKPFKAVKKGFMAYHNALQNTGNRLRSFDQKVERRVRNVVPMGNRMNSFMQSNVSRAKEDHEHNKLMKKLIKQKGN
jgi:hypothetical protein